MIEAVILTGVLVLVPALGFAALILQDMQEDKERARLQDEYEAEAERIRQHIEERRRYLDAVLAKRRKAYEQHLHQDIYNWMRQQYERDETIETTGRVVHRRALPARTRYDA